MWVIERRGRGRVEILGRERRRTWTAEQKLGIVAESLGAEPTPMYVASSARKTADRLNQKIDEQART
jgi:hypothetical protein